MGFGVRKAYTNKSKKDGSVTSVRFLCSKEGLRRVDKRDHLTKNPRQETRTDCKVRMGLTNENGIFRVSDLIEDHNHVLQTPKTAHMLPSQRNISEVQAHEIELAEDSGLQQRASYELFSRHVGGRDHLGFTRLDQKNYLRTRRQKSLKYGEAGCLLRYFQEQTLIDPSFYRAFQMDNEEQITNIFWADARMRLDYGGVVIFGAALLYDETAASFEWLFKTFLEANLQEKPQTIFTDQDPAMAKALHKILDANEIMHVPDQYILKRLTKDARSGVIMDFKGNEVVEDPKLARTMRYRQLCLKQIKLSSDAADFEQAFLLVDKAVDELIKQVAELRLKSNEAVNHPNSEVPKGYGNQMNFDVPSRSENTFSFTKFLMEPLLTPLGGSEFYGGFSNENDDQASE
ncbi:protein FAR1-RELATED SEQUENCE 5-like [Senna tora]|uniref:Protein FAR1-RELATED SEQUENCE 5-like n=1 Tax=Senna tora TaxID=362788 RepID=A0A834WGX3_9FABA|nr:protein FAR1-RELATED SEQUENCE 5-like [Senna tora]